MHPHRKLLPLNKALLLKPLLNRPRLNRAAGFLLPTLQPLLLPLKVKLHPLLLLKKPSNLQ